MADLFVSIPLGAAVFWGVCRALKLRELESAFRAVVTPVARLVVGSMLKSRRNAG